MSINEEHFEIEGAAELDAADCPTSQPFHKQRNPRIYLRGDVVDRLVKLGVSDDVVSIAHAVNTLTDMGLTLGYASIPDATDLVIMEQSLSDRMEELTHVTLSLMRLLVELSATSEYKTLFHSFKKLAKTQAPQLGPQ